MARRVLTFAVCAALALTTVSASSVRGAQGAELVVGGANTDVVSAVYDQQEERLLRKKTMKKKKKTVKKKKTLKTAKKTTPPPVAVAGTDEDATVDLEQPNTEASEGSAFEDSFSAITTQLNLLDTLPKPTTTEDCSEGDVLAWLQPVSKIVNLLATGAYAGPPDRAMTAMTTLANTVATSKKLMGNDKIAAMVASLVAPMWNVGYFYVDCQQWGPAMMNVYKAALATNSDAVVGQLASIIRFTKDWEFSQAVADDLTTSYEGTKVGAYLTVLSECVTETVRCKTPVTPKQVRAFMTTLKSKRDGMNMKAPFPVFTDTKTYRSEDVAAVKAFLNSLA